MVALVAGSLEDAEEDESRGDGGIQNTQEDDGRHHEGESDLFVNFVTDGTKSRGFHVLGPGVCVDDRSNETEDDDFGDRNGRDRFPEITRLFHLRNETGKRDLTNKGIADVQESVHSSNKGRPFWRYSEDIGLALCWGVSSWMVFNCGENCGQDDGDERCRCRYRRNV